MVMLAMETAEVAVGLDAFRRCVWLRKQLKGTAWLSAVSSQGAEPPAARGLIAKSRSRLPGTGILRVTAAQPKPKRGVLPAIEIRFGAANLEIPHCLPRAGSTWDERAPG